MECDKINSFIRIQDRNPAIQNKSTFELNQFNMSIKPGLLSSSGLLLDCLRREKEDMNLDRLDVRECLSSSSVADRARDALAACCDNTSHRNEERVKHTRTSRTAQHIID